MLSGEAEGITEPRSTILKHKSSNKTMRGYFLAICILFAIIVTLCINYFLLYNTYQTDKQKFVAAYEKIKDISESKNKVEVQSNELIQKNNEFEKKYQKVAVQNAEILKQMDEVRKQYEAIKQQNDELLKKNKELTEDNIELQNSLKKAAAVGIKPQNYRGFSGLNSRSEIDRGSYIGKFLGTAYTPSKDECGNNKGITNSGHPIVPGISVAVDNKYWPFGTIFYIKGLGYAIAMDTGSAIKGKYRFDFAVFDKNFAKMLGSRRWEVYLVKRGNGKVGEVKL